ncbi:MAG: hypothetical protein WCP39_06325, partial [Chlamydiota bacterium]
MLEITNRYLITFTLMVFRTVYVPLGVESNSVGHFQRKRKRLNSVKICYRYNITYQPHQTHNPK